MNHNLKKKNNKLHEGSSGTFLLSVLRNWEIVIIKMTKLLRGNVSLPVRRQMIQQERKETGHVHN